MSLLRQQIPLKNWITDHYNVALVVMICLSALCLPACKQDRTRQRLAALAYRPAGQAVQHQSVTMPDARYAHKATEMGNGNIFIAGGIDNHNSISKDAFAFNSGQPHYFYDVDPTDPIQDLVYPRILFDQAQVTQRDGSFGKKGSILIFGGEVGYGITNIIENYDPSTDTLTVVGRLIFHRRAHTVTEIKNSGTVFDGQFLIVGGVGAYGLLKDAELFNPETGYTTVTFGRMEFARHFHKATPLRDGRILITGGFDKNGITDKAEIFDPKTQKFKLVPGHMTEPRVHHTATYLDNKTPDDPSDDAVLIAGGLDRFGFSLDNAEFYDPDQNRFVPVNSITQEPVFYHTAVALPQTAAYDAAILGGYTNLNFQAPLQSDPTDHIEVFQYTYHPGTGPDGFFIHSKDMMEVRAIHTTNAMDGHGLLILGGVDEFGIARASGEEISY